jgi:hypothetical protein
MNNLIANINLIFFIKSCRKKIKSINKIKAVPIVFEIIMILIIILLFF